MMAVCPDAILSSYLTTALSLDSILVSIYFFDPSGILNSHVSLDKTDSISIGNRKMVSILTSSIFTYS